jgi:predicted nuclease of predicted toxin-antitoxin system
LSLRLLLDEDSQSKRLVSVLRKGGHEVLTINEITLAGSSDDVVLNYARAKNWILLTHNCDDFEDLHKINPNHPGILAVYRSSNRSKNMSFKDIVHAIDNFEASSCLLANQFIPLNHWSY